MKVNKINILGIGPGNKKYILPLVYKMIDESEVVIGGKRNLINFDLINKEVIEISGDIKKIIDYIKSNSTKVISVLASGDPTFFGIAKTMHKYFTADQLNIVPGISSVQYLFCRLGKSWDDYYLTSIHGQDIDIIEIIKKNKKAVLLTDKNNDYKMIAGILKKNNFGECQMTVASNLSYEDEKIETGKAVDFIKSNIDNKLCIVVVENE